MRGADGGYAGEKLATAISHILDLVIEIIKCSDDAKGFVVLPKRWVVERTFAWLGRCRRLAKDCEATIASSEAWLLLASIRRMTRAVREAKPRARRRPRSNGSPKLRYSARGLRQAGRCHALI